MANIAEIDFKARNLTAFGELVTAQLSPIFQGTFEYTVDNTELAEKTTTGGGNISQANAMAVLQTGTSLGGGTALLQSKTQLKYHSGFGMEFRFSTLFEEPAANCRQMIGALDEAGASTFFKNGFAIGYNGTTLTLFHFSNDVLTSYTTASAEWFDALNGNGQSGMTFDPTKLNVWKLSIPYLGAGPIQLFIENDDEFNNKWSLVASINYPNNFTSPSSLNPNYKVTWYIDNNSTTTNYTLKGASYAGFVQGKTDLIEIHQPSFSTGKQSVTGALSSTPIFTIRVRSTYNSYTNFVDILLKRLSASIEANASSNQAEIVFIKNGTLGGVPSWTDINTSDCVVEIDNAATSVTGGKELLTIPLSGKNDRVIENMVPYKFTFRAGDTLSAVATSSNNADLDVWALWTDLF